MSVNLSTFVKALRQISLQRIRHRRYYTGTPPLGGQMQRGLALFSFLLATTLHAQDDTYRNAYVSHVEGEISLQRASEPEPESGSLNAPILPGDRIWTRAGSRAEIRFGSGLVVRLSEGAKMDFVAIDSETILRLWSGSAIVKIAEPPGSVRIDSPAGSIRPTREGSYRIDVDSGDAVTLSVERGSAELAAREGTVLVQSGETSFATPSDPPSIPVKFNTASLDDFDRWSESRESRISRTEDIVVRSLPHQVQSYAYELADHGEWYQEPDHGYVWYPRVETGWAPYTYGRWGYTSYGQTWISSEPWGWAPYHYGRWGFGHRGWYWIPGATWGPAWVSFAIGPAWVGWSPLGYLGGPVFAFNSYYGGYGGNYGRGGFGHDGGGWNVCSRADFRSGVVTPRGYRRLEPEDLRASASSARFMDEASSLDRDLNPRVARLRPSASALGATADPPKLGVGGSGYGQARPPSPASRRSEDALRGFRERATTSSSRVLDELARTGSRRGERPDNISDTVRRARELQGPSNSDGREGPARERFGSSPRSESTPRERSVAGSSAPETPAATERRERFERARERVTPILPSREIPSMRSTRPPRVERESSPRTRAPQTTSEPRSRVERAAPRGQSPARDFGGGGRSSGASGASRERSPSVSAPSSGARAGQGASQRSRGAQSPRSGGTARPRSNRG